MDFVQFGGTVAGGVVVAAAPVIVPVLASIPVVGWLALGVGGAALAIAAAVHESNSNSKQQ